MCHLLLRSRWNQCTELIEIELREISVVETPADNSAHISSVKSATKLKDVEQVLRQKGFSQAEATALVASVKRIQKESMSEGAAVSSA